MKEIIKESLANSYTYAEYRAIVSGLLAEGKSSGNQQSDELTHYSQLNETRMNRLEKTIGISAEHSNALQSLKGNYTWLVISEGWCGDAAQLVPILYKLSEISGAIDMKIVFRDENEALMDLFLTNGGRAIPKLIVLERDSNKVRADWGPRPKGATELIKRFKAEFGKIDEKAKTELQLWYLHDKGVSTQEEIAAIMKGLE